jgi:dihydrofolate synthase / folylpolyglutamate synthase
MNKFSNYKDCIKYLFGLERVGIKYDLKNIRTILKFLGNPERNFKSIHIAGTNGKGSVASIINSVFIENGFKTGLYTSPHIKDFRERILVSGKMIPRNYVIDFTNRLYKLLEKIKPSFFEASTAMAFEYFANQNVDYGVIEAGLGGRLDSTNVLRPLISIITGIAIDHTEYLGDTIESIAFEKAGIIKKNIPCIVGYMEKKAYAVMENKCKEKESEIINSEKLWDVRILKYDEDIMKLQISRKNAPNNKITLNYPVIGKYQCNNIKTAFTAIDEIGKNEIISFDEKCIKSGFENIIKNSIFYGRFQKISNNPKIIIDVSHNVQGIKNIRDNLKYFNYKNLYVIFGMMKDKEYKKCLSELEKLEATIVLTKPNYKRAEEPVILYKSVKKKEKFFIAESLNAAYNNLKTKTGKRDLILITGSFYLINDFLKLKPFHL